VRMLNTPPAVVITTKESSAAGNKVIIRLELSDSDYQFRGFSPFAFALAGEKRTIIANTPSKVVLNGEEVSGLSTLQKFRTAGETSELILEFKANRSDEELLSLKDLWLWYNSVKIAHIALAVSSGTP
jgi:hypothetical protein